MFNFKLQRVLDLRERQEQERAVELANARAAEQSAREKCEALEAAKANGLRSAVVSEDVRVSIGQLQNMSAIIDHLNVHIDLAHAEADSAEQAVGESMDELMSAFRDRNVLDRLRERHFNDWRAAEEHLDRATMDEIALSRFVRSKNALAGTQ